MPILHMETESVRQVGHQCQQVADTLQQGNQQIFYAANNLSIVWESPDTDVFVANIQSLLNQLNRFAVDGERLNYRLQNEAAQWEQVGQGFGGSHVSIEFITLGDFSDSDPIYEPFDWLVWSSSIFPAFDLLPKLSHLKYENFKDIGRFFNRLAGNPRAGWVGCMDDMGHSLKDPNLQKILDNKWLGRAADGIPVGLNIMADIRDDGDWDKAIITNLAGFGAEKLLYAIPFVGPVYAFYDIGLGVAHLGAGGMELLGFHDQAVWLENTLDIIDPGEWIDKGLEWVYDEYLNDAVTPIFDEVSEAVADFGSGLIDDAGDIIGGAGDLISGWF